MRIHRDVRVGHACAPGIKRPECFPFLQIVKGRGKKPPTGCLVATDNRIAVVVPVEIDKDDRAGLMTRDALSVAQTHAPRKGGATLVCGARIGIPDADQEHGRPDMTDPFPSWEPILPPKDRKGDRVLRIDAIELDRLRRALGHRYLELRVPEDEMAPVRVDVAGVAAQPGACGAIIPLSEAEISTATTPKGADDDGDDDAELPFD